MTYLPENTREERLRRELYALTEVSKTLTLPLELHELLDAVLQKIIVVIEQADVGVVMLWDQAGGLFRPEAAFGFDMEILKGMGLRAGESITGKVFDDNQARLLATPEEVASFMSNMRPANRAIMIHAMGSDAMPRCTLAVPISVEKRKSGTASRSNTAHRYGVLVLETVTSPQPFTPNDLPFVQTLADLVALAIDRSYLEARADAVRAERQAEQMRSELMATLSHELRMPLSAIRGYASALMIDNVEWSQEKRLEFLDIIERESENMQSMLRDILDSSIIDVDQLHIERQPLRLQHVARDVVAEMQHRTGNHRFIADFPVNFPIVEADPRWIKQVFRNVLDNAVKYSPDGGLIMIRGETRPTDVMVSVSDQGVGISPEDLIPLFEKYFRVKTATGFHVPGTGLGLPIARTLVEVHGGRIWAESKVGQGTTLYFSLPRSPEISPEEEP